MKLTMVRGDNAAVVVGGQWVVEFYTTDVYGYLAAADETTVLVTLPDGDTEVPLIDIGSDGGVYKLLIEVTQQGRYTAAITAEDMQTVFISAEALPITGEDGMPTAGDVVKYLGEGTQAPEESWAVSEITDALAAERAAQARICRIPATYPPDLRRALLRRVQRALALSQQPRAGGFNDGEAAVLPTNDPEVRRLERPYRKVILG